jgi:hypothetical protein
LLQDEEAEIRNSAGNLITAGLAALHPTSGNKPTDSDAKGAIASAACASRVMEVAFGLFVVRWDSEPVAIEELLRLTDPSSVAQDVAAMSHEQPCGDREGDSCAAVASPDEDRLFGQDDYAVYGEWDVCASVAAAALGLLVKRASIPRKCPAVHQTWKTLQTKFLPDAMESYQEARRAVDAAHVHGLVGAASSTRACSRLARAARYLGVLSSGRAASNPNGDQHVAEMDHARSAFDACLVAKTMSPGVLDGFSELVDTIQSFRET